MAANAASLQQQYATLLSAPEAADDTDLHMLLAAYPYSHVLWFMAAKRFAHRKDAHQALLHQAALYVGDNELLCRYIYNEPKPISLAITDQQEAVAKLDVLLSQHKENAEPQAVTVSMLQQQEAPHIREDVTKYDDEHMPYTFVWWLHKTRLEHAGTYRPYASSAKPSLKQIQEDVSDIVLDQQIRENIFHLQSPEDKLSVHESKAIKFKIPHKTDDLIERFIKEEPQIKAPQVNQITLENKARQSAEDESTFVSETLAQIYEEQGLYHKAIDAYMKLSLKYPKKSAYFADRIKDLENKIN